jgi:hypothetical protein
MFDEILKVFNADSIARFKSLFAEYKFACSDVDETCRLLALKTDARGPTLRLPLRHDSTILICID